MSWEVTLAGDKDDLRQLSQTFNRSGLTITFRDDVPILVSTRFERHTNRSEILAIATDLLIPINAGLKIVMNGGPLIVPETVVQRDDAGNVVHYVEISAGVTHYARISAVHRRADGSVVEENETEPLLGWYDLARQDEHVAKALYLIAHDFATWSGLYMILEVMEEGGCSACRRGAPLKPEIDRFTRTAESFQALGIQARHAHSRFTPPDPPMTLEEAKYLIRRLMLGWLEESGQHSEAADVVR